MEDAGYGPEARLAVDDDYAAFARHFHRMLDATKLVDAPKPKPGARPQMAVPAHTFKELMAELDLGPEQRSSAVVAQVLDDRAWDAIDLWDDDDES